MNQTRIHPASKGMSSDLFLHKRAVNFGVTLIVMGVSFAMYYLGFFGGVEGPLSGEQLGERLAGLGVRETHILVFFLTLLVFTSLWNWIYNLGSYLGGTRMTCKKLINGNPCGASTKRVIRTSRKNGKEIRSYVCQHGHLMNEAHFHPIRKGMFSHTLWLISAAFCGILLFFT